MYYHVRITQKSNSAHDETKLDLTEEQLRERFLQPYELGQPILINGKTIPSNDIERVREIQKGDILNCWRGASRQSRHENQNVTLAPDS